MQARILVSYIPVLFCLFTLSAKASAQTNEKAENYPATHLTVGIGDARPYIYVSNNSVPQHKPGYSAQFVQEIASRLNWQIAYRVLPFKRQLAELNSGSIDSVIGLFNVPSSRFIYSATPVGKAELCIFKLCDNPFVLSNDVLDLQGQKLGGGLGYSYGILDEY